MEDVQVAEKGTQLFMLAAYYPILICIITVGDWRINNNREMTRDFSCDFKGESHLPLCPGPLARDAHKEGYKWYCHRERALERGGVLLTYTDWLEDMDTVQTKIDNLIAQDHGVKVYRDGNLENNTIGNVVVLHVSDILMMFFHREETQDEHEPKVALQSASFSAIPSTYVDSLMTNVLSVADINFIRNNLDIFFVIYTLWGNFSFLPIRIEPSDFVKGIPMGETILKDEFFVGMQRGKFQELKRMMKTPVQKIYFALI